MIIETPRGKIITVKLKNGTTKAKLVWNEGFGQEINNNFTATQKFVDSECLRHTDSYVPFKSGMLKKSGILGSVIGSGKLIYNAPYARKNYYKNRGNGIQGTSNGGKRGKLFFERMKSDHKKQILAGAQRIMEGRK